MDYSDTTVLIPVKDEPAAGKVTKEVLNKLSNCKVVVIYKGDRDSLNINFTNKNLLIMKQRGSGKGVACVQARKNIKTDIMCLIDGDATYDVNDLKKAITMVREGMDMAVGNRFKDIDREAMPQYIEIGNKIITQVQNLLYNLRLTDSQTGLRAMKRYVFDSLDLKEKYFGIETEMNVKAKKAGYKIGEVPIHYYKRVGSSKQLKLIDGVKLLLLDFKFLF